METDEHSARTHTVKQSAQYYNKCINVLNQKHDKHCMEISKLTYQDCESALIQA